MIDPKELTVDYRKLLTGLSGIERKQLSKKPVMGLMEGVLSPTDMAKLFPDYFRKKSGSGSGLVPDFTSVPRSVPVQYGDQYSRVRREASYPKDRTKAPAPGEVDMEELSRILLAQSIDIDKDYNSIGASPTDMPKSLEGMSDEALKAAGLSRVDSPMTGKPLIMRNPSKVENIPDDEIKKALSKEYIPSKEASDSQKSVISVANELGVDPLDLATVISYESAGSFDPYKKGPVDQRSSARAAVAAGADPHMRGLIQFGADEQLKFGIHPDMTFEEGMEAVGKYLKSRGLDKWLKDNPGASLEEKRTALYSTINAGSPDKKYWGNKDAWMGGAPGSVYDKAQEMFKPEGDGKITHAGRAQRFMGDSIQKGMGENVTPEQITEYRENKFKEELKEENINNTNKLKLEYKKTKLDNNNSLPPEKVSSDMVNEKQKKQAAIRKGELDDDVRDALQYSAERNGVKVEVVSGGQMSIEEAVSKGAKKIPGSKDWMLPSGERVRTGSVRHDEGGAGDVKLYREVNGKKVYLSMNNKDDREVMKSFAKDSVSAGMTGIGAGSGYMGDETIHIGKGKVASWGGASWVGDALKEGLDNPVDMNVWRENKSKMVEEEKKKLEESVKVSEASPKNMPKNRPFSLAPGSKISEMKEKLNSEKNTESISSASPAGIAPVVPQITENSPSPPPVSPNNAQSPVSDDVRPPPSPMKSPAPAPAQTQSNATVSSNQMQPQTSTPNIGSSLGSIDISPSASRALYRDKNPHLEPVTV